MLKLNKYGEPIWSASRRYTLEYHVDTTRRWCTTMPKYLPAQLMAAPPEWDLLSDVCGVWQEPLC